MLEKYLLFKIREKYIVIVFTFYTQLSKNLMIRFTKFYDNILSSRDIMIIYSQK